MQVRKVSMQEIEDYLWAQHAPERNAQNAKAGIQDGSGLTDGEARDILAGRAVTKNGRTIQLNAAKMQDYRDLAARSRRSTTRLWTNWWPTASRRRRQSISGSAPTSTTFL